MAYTPTLVIRRADLERNREKIESAEYTVSAKKNKRNEEKLARLKCGYRALEEALNHAVVSFPEIELVLVELDTTYESKSVMDLMDELGIDYRKSI